MRKLLAYVYSPLQCSYLATFLCVFSLSHQLVAEENQAQKKPLYVGGLYGFADYNDDGLYNPGEIDSSKNTMAIYGGARINSWLSTEVQYADLGNYKNTDQSLQQLKVYNSHYSALTFSARFNYDINQRIELFSKAGVSLLNLQQDYTMFSTNKKTFNSFGGGLYLAAGATYNINNQFSLIAQYDMHLFEVDSSVYNISNYYSQSINAFSLGVEYRF